MRFIKNSRSFFIIILAAIFCLNLCYAQGQFNKDEIEFMKLVARQTFNFFWQEIDPDTFISRSATYDPTQGCITTMGFAFCSIIIAHDQGWITYDQAYNRILNMIKNFVDDPDHPAKLKMLNEHGHPYHFINARTGEYYYFKLLEASDTCVFISGLIVAGEYFKGTKIEKIADFIIKAVDWSWFLDKKRDGMYTNWFPGKGFDGIGIYSGNLMGLLPILLGISSPTHPIPVKYWFNLAHSFCYNEYNGYNYFGDCTSYTYQWPFCFIDPALKKDYFIDYFQNLREHSLAERDWCIHNRTMGYHENNWGLNVAMGPRGGWFSYGAPVFSNFTGGYDGRDNDGTVPPTAAISFFPFTPQESYNYMKYIYDSYQDKVFGKYGFVEAYNIKEDWWCKDYVGLDSGPIIVMLGNYFNKIIWKNFMKNKYIRKGLKKIGFIGILDNFDESSHSPVYADWTGNSCFIISKQTNVIKEGEHALMIQYSNISPADHLTITPQLKDYSDYDYFSFWTTESSLPGIVLSDNENRKAELKYISRLQEGDWTLYYYSLQKLKINKNNIEKIYFYPDSSCKKNTGKVYLDLVHLTYNLFDKKPPRPQNFTAEQGRYEGEINISWVIKEAGQGQGNIVNSRIKISETSIRTWQDFQNAADIKTMKDFKIQYDDHQYRQVLDYLEPGKEYYIALAQENNVYALSDFVTVKVTANPVKDKEFSLTAEELVRFNLTDFITFQAEGDIIRIEKVEGKYGEALNLQYNMCSSERFHFAGVKKDFSGRLPQNCRFIFYVKGRGVKNTLEFKLFDDLGNMYGIKINDLKFNNTWEKVIISAPDIKFWWGPEQRDRITRVKSMEFVLSGEAKGEGELTINKLVLEKAK